MLQSNHPGNNSIYICNYFLTLNLFSKQYVVCRNIKEASDLMAKEIEEEEIYEAPDAGQEATTSLGSLFANIKLD